MDAPSAAPPQHTAPLSRRVAAWGVDWLAWLAVVAAFALLGGALLPDAPGEDRSDGQGLGTLVAVLVLAVAWVAMLARGATPGLVLLSLRLERGDGRRPGVPRALLRWAVPAAIRLAALWLEAIILVGAAFAGGTGLLVGLPLLAAIEAVRHVPHAWALLRRDRRTLYDLLAGTRMVRR